MRRLRPAGRGWLSFALTFAGLCTEVIAGVQIDEVLAGANGDSRVQFVELRICCGEQEAWGPQGGELVGRVRLVFFDATGSPTGEFVFLNDPPIGSVDPFGGRSVLVGTQGFADVAGMPAPDYLIPALIITNGGQVCLRGNPANPNAPSLNVCLSYGPFVGPMESDTLLTPIGTPAGALSIVGTDSLQRIQNFSVYDTGQLNADFALAPAAPRNSAGDTGVIGGVSLRDQGQTLFLFERFQGNGRTCGTCHRPNSSFSLSPAFVATLAPDDPLFIAELNPALAELENACLVRGPRTLILANVDGFDHPSVFRAPPHLQNVGATAPFGQSGEVPTLRAFATAAVRQHFPKTLNRNADPSAGAMDFRLPVSAELDALDAFMQSIVVPADRDFDLGRMLCSAVHNGANSAAVQRGRDLFFGAAKCSLCHSGPLLFEADAGIGGGRSFNTGVALQAVNEFDACVGGPLLYPDSATRAFNTPPLINVKNTSPYFHDNSAATLTDAIRFYNGPEFNQSPGGSLVGGITVSPANVNDLTAFLEALVEPGDCLVDDDPPTIQCPSDIVADALTEVCQKFVTVPVPTAGDNCCLKDVNNSVTLTSNASGLYSVGQTLVTWTATDFRGNSAQCTHLVTVTGHGCCLGGGLGDCNKPVVEVALRAIPDGQPTTPEQGTLPVGIIDACPGEAFLLEVWVSEVDGGTKGIRKGFVDVGFDPDVVRGQAPIDHGSLYNAPPPRGSINNNTGVLDEIGGIATAQGLAVAPNWGLLARVRMTPQTIGDAPFTLSHATNTFALVGTGTQTLDNVRVDVSDTLTVRIGDTTPPQLAGCPTDIAVPCDRPDGLGVVLFTVPSTADDCDPAPTVVCRDGNDQIVIPGQHLSDGTVITCRTEDASGNLASCPAFVVHVTGVCPCADEGEAAVDCDDNGVPDSCDIAHGTHDDCNGNGVPDPCDVSPGASVDCNADGRPDECGVLSACEVARLTAFDQAAGDRFGTSVNLSGDVALIGARLDHCANNAPNCGSAYIFRREPSGWIQKKKLMASDAATEDLFGWGTALDGDCAVVGARMHNTPAGADSGQAYVYRETLGQWTEEAKLTADPGGVGDQFGTAVGVSGDTIVVGAPLAECSSVPGSDCGAAYLFGYDGLQWVPELLLAPDDLAAGDNFGTEVAIDGDLCVISSPFDECGNGALDCGSAYVFHRTAGVWQQEAKIHGGDSNAGDNFGIAVSLRANLLVVGANADSCIGGASDCGSAYVFRRSAGAWTEEKKLRAGDAAAFDSFASAVATDGEQILIGSRLDDCPDGTLNCGSAYVYHRIGGSWTQVAKLIPTDATEDDIFGVSVALDHGTAILGAYNRDCLAGGIRCGAAYIASLVGDDCDCDTLADACEYGAMDYDEDGELDPCDVDVDGDGVGNTADVCDFTPLGVAVDSLGQSVVGPAGYCPGELIQYRTLCQCLALSPQQIGVWHPWCVDVFDLNADGGVNLRDYAAFQRNYRTPPNGQSLP